MLLKLTASLCTFEKTYRLCEKNLRNVSLKLREIMLEGVSTKIVNLTLEKTNLVRTMKGNSAVEKFNLI